MLWLLLMNGRREQHASHKSQFSPKINDFSLFFALFSSQNIDNAKLEDVVEYNLGEIYCGETGLLLRATL